MADWKSMIKDVKHGKEAWKEVGAVRRKMKREAVAISKTSSSLQASGRKG